MVELTGSALLQQILDTIGVSISELLQIALTARLQAAIDAGSASDLQIAAVLGANPQILASVPEGQLPLTYLSTVVGDAKDTIVTPPVIEFSLTASATEVDEGGSVDFTIAAVEGEDALVEGTEVDYAITGIDADDTDDALTGTATVGVDGTASVTVTLKEDTTTEGEETMTLAASGASANVTVNDTSISNTADAGAGADADADAGTDSNVGETYILTDQVDALLGTSGNDLFLGSTTTWNVDVAIDAGAGVDTLSIANDAEDFTLEGRTLLNLENLKIINVDPDSGDQDFNFSNKMLDLVTIDYADTENLNDLYLNNMRADTDLVVENVIADRNLVFPFSDVIYRNDAGVSSTLTGSVTQNNTLSNIDFSVNDSGIDLDDYSYFSAATELNLNTTVENVITGGTTTTGSDESLYLYNYIEMQADNATINLTYNLSDILIPDGYGAKVFAYVDNGLTVASADVVNVVFNIDNVDGFYSDIYPDDVGENSESDSLTFNVAAGGLANSYETNYFYGAGFETVNLNIDGDTEFDDFKVYSSVRAAQTINIVANANLTIGDTGGTFDAADRQHVTINISGAGDVTFDLFGDNHGVTVNAGSATGNLDLGIGSDAPYAKFVTAGSGDDTITTGAGFDNISGGAGNDVISSGNGGSEIIGGAGEDTITLGSGAAAEDIDFILFTAVTDSQAVTVDIINGFQVDVQATTDTNADDIVDATDIINDVLNLSAVVIGAASYAGEASGYGAVLTSLTGDKINSQAVLDTSTSTLYVDVDASGTLDTSDMAIQLTGLTEMSALNFAF